MRSSCPTSEARVRSAIRLRVAFCAALATSAACVEPALAQETGADRAGAIVVFPLIRVDGSDDLDTFLRLANASAAPLDLRCFFENTTRHCSSDSMHCETEADCQPGSTCNPGWTITDFRIRLTAGQPVEWRASDGLALLPAPDNQGSIPAVAEDPFTGALRCFVIDGQTGFPPGGGGAADSLEGVATIERVGEAAVAVARYRAFGFPSFASDGDGTLELGFGLEYGACPSNVVLSQLFEGAAEPVDGASASTELALVPCAADYLLQSPVADVVHLNVYNEFEQRVGLSARLGPQLFAPLSRIHPTVFDVGVQGTLAGQTRIRGAGAGVVGLSVRALSSGAGSRTTQAFGLHNQGQRLLDVISLPPP